MLEVMRSLYEHAYEGLDRDVGLQIAEESNKSQTRVPGIGWFYGELSWSGSWDLIGLAKPREGDVFVDLGSGLGKMVLSAAMTRRFKECRGVEILPELHGKATAALGRLRDAVGEESFAMLPPMRLECGDMLAADGFAEDESLHLLRHDLTDLRARPHRSRRLRRGSRRDLDATYLLTYLRAY